MEKTWYIQIKVAGRVIADASIPVLQQMAAARGNDPEDFQLVAIEGTTIRLFKGPPPNFDDDEDEE